MMMKKMMIVRRRRRRRRQNRYHERVPWHRGEKTLKDLCGTKLVNNPVIAVTVDYRLIEVEQTGGILDARVSTAHAGVSRRRWRESAQTSREGIR